jgi:hypothetical protein
MELAKLHQPTKPATRKTWLAEESRRALPLNPGGVLLYDIKVTVVLRANNSIPLCRRRVTHTRRVMPVLHCTHVVDFIPRLPERAVIIVFVSSTGPKHTDNANAHLYKLTAQRESAHLARTLTARR